jgi:hypothetical protein
MSFLKSGRDDVLCESSRLHFSEQYSVEELGRCLSQTEQYCWKEMPSKSSSSRSSTGCARASSLLAFRECDPLIPVGGVVVGVIRR